MSELLASLKLPEDALQHFQVVLNELDGNDHAKHELIAGLKRILEMNSGLTKSTQGSSSTTNCPTPSLRGVLCTMPDVSFLFPRGSFSVDFAETGMELRGKAGVHLLERTQMRSVLILEQDSKINSTLVLFQTTNPSATMFLASVKGNNAGKFQTQRSPSAGEGEVPFESLVQSDKVKRDELFLKLISLSFMPALGDEIPRLENLNTGFKSTKGHRWIQCNYKNVNEGKLFFLRDGLLFVGSPLTFIPEHAVDQVYFERSNSRTFEIHLVMKPQTGGTPSAKKPLVHEFSQINVDECPAFENFLSETKFAQQKQKKRQEVSPSLSSGSTARASPEIGSSLKGEERELEEEEDSSEAEDDADDDESLSSDDSPYSSSIDSSTSEGGDDDHDDGDEAEGEEGGSAVEDKDENVEGEGEDSSDNEHSSTDNSSDDSDVGDADVADLVQEEKFVPEPGDVIESGRKRRRNV